MENALSALLDPDGEAGHRLPPYVGLSEQEAELAREAAEKTREVMGHLSPYERAFLRVREAERNAAQTGEDIAQERIAAQRQLELEDERATDETWRGRRNVDQWRAEGGRDQYNAGRRKVRAAANTSKEVLAAMSPEERQEHIRKLARERARRFRGRKKDGA
ncbi:hypothetical protein ATO6_12315 [Oceanicola sp. 22II-s10i]|nr:hypothetical protein ATO6_12315 [Oceanicola sp. 22II-s10i]